ncbi:2-keto-3-deoxygluconate permease [Sedimentibacter sp. B4]|uniref:2-keto-3-deoxygluconate permease n=1 Tax=Sedimentibacter sp. B4 TaxID=304766 RepID=UPI0003059B41|nr:2-keto-3-deoxygluconate permease [Sedimentibacter sp. B4]
MRIMKGVNKIPGGIMVVPLFIAAAINTFIPDILNIGTMTTAFFSKAGTATLIGMALFCTGTQLKIKETPEVLKRGFVLLIAKFLAGFIIGLLVGKFGGAAGFFGISALAIYSAVTNSNAGLYIALMGDYGDKKDIGAVSILALNDGPFMTMIALGASGAADIPVMIVVSTIVPMIVGCILGNLDDEISQFFRSGTIIAVPMFSFCLGAAINFNMIFASGFSGILLGIITVVCSGGLSILADRYILKRPGYAGAAISTAAANAVATPAAVALAVPALADVVPAATAQIATAVIFTAIFSPMLTAWVAKKFGCPKYDNLKVEELL